MWSHSHPIWLFVIVIINHDNLTKNVCLFVGWNMLKPIPARFCVRTSCRMSHQTHSANLMSPVVNWSKPPQWYPCFGSESHYVYALVDSIAICFPLSPVSSRAIDFLYSHPSYGGHYVIDSKAPSPGRYYIWTVCTGIPWAGETSPAPSCGSSLCHTVCSGSSTFSAEGTLSRGAGWTRSACTSSRE